MGESAGLWEVVGGGASGGIVVKTRKDTKSEEVGRLSKGATVAQLVIDGERMRYTLLTGTGPLDGWVSLKFKGKPLLIAVGEEGTQAAKDDAEIKAAKEQQGERRGKGRIWLLPMGTRGDCQPFLALAVGLRRAGYSCRIISSPTFKDFVESQGVDFTPIGVDIRSLVKSKGEKASGATKEDLEEQQQKIKEMMQAKKDAGEDVSKVMLTEALAEGEMAQSFTENFFAEDVQKSNTRTLMALLEVDKPDMVFFASLAGSTPWYVWRMCQCPMYKLDFQPSPNSWIDPNSNHIDGQKEVGEWIETETGTNPFEGVSQDEWTEWHKSHCLYMAPASIIDAIFAQWAIPEELTAGFKSTAKGSLILDLSVSLRDMSWFGGFDNLERMQTFLDKCLEDPKCPRPFYIGWGSMPIPIQMLTKVVVTLKMNKWRAIICSGWADLTPEAFEESLLAMDPADSMGLLPFIKTNICFVNVAPHEWLFRRCCATVHHGGAGTTIAALRAGVPTCITPFGFDQEMHANWVEHNNWGKGFSLLLNADKVMDPVWSKTWRSLISDKNMIARCQENGEKLMQEDVVGDLVALVGKELESRQPLAEGERRKFGV